MEQNLRGNETILLVDDEESIIDIIGMALKMLGYEVLIAKEGQEALRTYRSRKDQIALVILDLLMPKMSGEMVFNLLKQINPAVKVLLTSGYDYGEETARIIERGGNGFIQKPFGVKELAQKIRAILGQK